MGSPVEHRSEPIPLTWDYVPFLLLGGFIGFLTGFVAGWIVAPEMALLIGFGCAARLVFERGFRGGLTWAVVAILASVAAYFAVIPFHQ